MRHPLENVSVVAGESEGRPSQCRSLFRVTPGMAKDTLGALDCPALFSGDQVWGKKKGILFQPPWSSPITDTVRRWAWECLDVPGHETQDEDRFKMGLLVDGW